MPLADVLGKFLPRVRVAGGSRNLVRMAWDLLAGVPGGKAVFSRLIGRAAPYTATIGAKVIALRPGWAEVEMADRRGVRNHLQCVHAIALANLAELAGNIAFAYSLPDGARFIVAGIEIEYLKKARGTLTAIAECPIPSSSARREYDVSVSIRDEAGEEVAHAMLRSLAGPVKTAAAPPVEARMVN